MASTDAELERSTLRKASWRLLPLIGFGYGAAYLDRANISFAALQMSVVDEIADIFLQDQLEGVGKDLRRRVADGQVGDDFAQVGVHGYVVVTPGVRSCLPAYPSGCGDGSASKKR